MNETEGRIGATSKYLQERGRKHSTSLFWDGIGGHGGGSGGVRGQRRGVKSGAFLEAPRLPRC